MAERISRRTLIEMSIAGGAAAAIAGGATPAAAAGQNAPPLPEGKKLGFAVVGLGKLSQGQILPELRNCRGAKLAALVSGTPDKAKRLAAEYGVPADAVYDYAGFDRIADDPRIDVVYIVLPNSMHAEYTIRALKAGKHVLCEKPMATTIADCEAMIAAAKAADRKLMIAYRLHFEPYNLEAMRRVRSGSLGKIRIVGTDMGRQTDLSDPSDVWRLDMKMSGGGAMTDIGIYGINAARYLLDEEPVEVRAWAHTDKGDPRFREVEDVIAWQMRFPSGALNNGSTSFSYSGTMKFDVIGENGRLRADPAGFYGGLKLELRSPGEAIPTLPNIQQFGREMDWMADVVRGAAPNVADGAEGLQDVRLMEALFESVRKGGAPVKVDWPYRRAFDPAEVVRG